MANDITNLDIIKHRQAFERFLESVLKNTANEDRTIRVLERIEHAIDGGKWNPGVRDSLEHLKQIEQHLGSIRDALQTIAHRMPRG